MNISQIEENVKSLVKKIDKESFIYDMLLAYGTPKATITRAKNGSKNLSKNENEIVIKKKVFFAYFDKDIDQEFERLRKDSSTQKHAPRFLIVTDYKTIKALDTKLDDKLEFPVKEFNKKFDFFLPLAGIERKEFQHENPVDVKAAEKLAKLFDLIRKDNPQSDPKSLHSLNVFLTRLLFCYFAEDTDIFSEGLFTNSVGSHTQADGSDLCDYLTKIFEIMNLEKRPKNTPDYLNKFPYVNGGLFAEKHHLPKFTKKSREALIDIGDLNWAEINPDIFGSMIQAVVHPEQRANLGMHYTSVTNIMKVIEPLFLNDLYEELKKVRKNESKLKKLLLKISDIKIFDPACGSGNFLIIAYKELRKIEMEILKCLPNEMKFSYIPLKNFYGIEIDDFAHEVAILSLWLAEHQMDVIFKQEFGEIKASLPLKDGGNIVNGNALELDWALVCPSEGTTYVIGNPPYLGGKSQSKSQKEEMKNVFNGVKNYKELDYIACWFFKASKYIQGDSKFAFVSTSSINQGAQVIQLWPLLFEMKLEIFFAHKPFLWSNNAKNKAAVTVAIIGMRPISKGPKIIYEKGNTFKVNNINGYLVAGPNLVIESRLTPLSDFPRLITGNSPYDNNNLRMSKEEKLILERDFPESSKFIRKAIGAIEMIKGLEKWCLWISNEDRDLAEKIPPIKKRITTNKQWRQKGGDVARGLVERPHQFRYTHIANESQIVIPIHTSDRRKYIPIGFFDKQPIILSSAAVIYDPPFYLFSILCSRIHNCWVELTAGRLKSDYRYLSATCYNTFPFPKVDNETLNKLEKSGLEILKQREKHSEKTLLELYDSDKMPEELKKAHEDNDALVESCYSKKVIQSDLDRMDILFKQYLKMSLK